MAARGTRRGASSPQTPASAAKASRPLRTQRLLLRGLRLADAPRIRRLAGDRDVATTTLLIPHPYEKGVAGQWIQAQRERQQKGREVTFAIVVRSRNQLIGVIGLSVTAPHVRGERGYWIGKPYWRRGYATEAAEAVLRYGFDTLGLNRICAYHFRRNPASGRVLRKLGMTHEATLRQHVLKWGSFEDLAGYGILRSEYRGSREQGIVPGSL